MEVVEPKELIGLGILRVGDIIRMDDVCYLVTDSVDESLGHYLMALDGSSTSLFQGEGYTLNKLRGAIISHEEKLVRFKHYSKEKYLLQIVER